MNMDETKVKRITNDIILSYVINVRLPPYLKSMCVTALHLIFLNTITDISFTMNLVLVCSKVILLYMQESIEDYLHQEGLCRIKIEPYPRYVRKCINKMFNDGLLEEDEFKFLRKELI